MRVVGHRAPTPAARRRATSAPTRASRSTRRRRPTHAPPAIAGTPRRRPDADRRPRHLDWHGPDRLHATSGAAATPTARTATTSPAPPARPTRSSRADVGSTRAGASSPAPTARRRDRDLGRHRPDRAAAPAGQHELAGLTGTAGTASTLTADNGTWDGTDAAHLHLPVAALRRDGEDCADIAGATGPTYSSRRRRRPDDPRGRHRDQRRGHDTSRLAPRPPSSRRPRRLTTAPAGVDRHRRDGGTLTADAGAWTGDRPDHLQYQWQRCDADGADCADIAGATERDLRARPAPTSATRSRRGHRDQRRRRDRDLRADRRRSPPSRRSTRRPPAVTGHRRRRRQLTADPGTWTGTGPINYTYQWQRCDADGADCVDIAGATDPTYTLADDDAATLVRRRHRDQRRRLRHRDLGRDRRRRRRPAGQHRRRRPSPAHRPTAARSPPTPGPGPARCRSTTRTSGSAATPTAPTAPTSPARPTIPTRLATTTSATRSPSS